MPKEILVELDRNQFTELQRKNPGYIILKFTAEWCGPCKKIKNQVENWFCKLPEEFVCAELDVDENFDIYAYMRAKKMVNGIPAILAYKKGNCKIGPDYSVLGSSVPEINKLFEFCVNDWKKTSLVCTDERGSEH